MKVILLDDAQGDFDSLYNYLEVTEPGLGDRLYQETLDAIDRIEFFPRSYARVYKNFRLCPLRKFKYGMYYHVGRSHVFVHAIFDLRQNPQTILRMLRSREK